MIPSCVQGPRGRPSGALRGRAHGWGASAPAAENLRPRLRVPKTASGGLGGYTGSTFFEKPRPVRVSRDLEREPRRACHMQARFYLPWVGRFASPDPARDQHFEATQSWNIYSYVQNSPTMQVDPTGMVTEFAEPDPDPDPDGGRNGNKSVAKELKQNRAGVEDHFVPKGHAVNGPDAGYAEVGGVTGPGADQAVANVVKTIENFKEAHEEAHPTDSAAPGEKAAYEHIEEVVKSTTPTVDGSSRFYVTRPEGSGRRNRNVDPKAKPTHVDKGLLQGKKKIEIAYWSTSQEKKPKPKPKPKATHRQVKRHKSQGGD